MAVLKMNELMYGMEEFPQSAGPDRLLVRTKDVEVRTRAECDPAAREEILRVLDWRRPGTSPVEPVSLGEARPLRQHRRDGLGRLR